MTINEFIILSFFFTECDYSSSKNDENETDSSSSLTQEQLKTSSMIEQLINFSDSSDDYHPPENSQCTSSDDDSRPKVKKRRKIRKNVSASKTIVGKLSFNSCQCYFTILIYFSYETKMRPDYHSDHSRS